MSNTKRKGNRNEYKSMILMENNDIKCTRSAASLGIWDIIGIGKNHVYLVQVKSNRKPPKKEMIDMTNFPDIYCDFCGNKISKRQIHIWKDYGRKPEILNIGEVMEVKLANINITDCWQNIYTDAYTFRVNHKNSQYLIEVPISKLIKFKLEELLSYIDTFFPNLSEDFKIKTVVEGYNNG